MKKLLFASTCIVLCMLLSACATGHPKTLDAVRNGTKVNYDPYKQVTKTIGPYWNFVESGGWGKYFLRHSSVGELEICQLYVDYKGFGWAFFDSASDINGKRLEVVLIDQGVQDGYATVAITEQVAVNIPNLEEYQNTGIDIRLYGKRANMRLYLPPYYVQGFLQSLEKRKH